MHALYVVVPVLCILAIAYRYYSAFIATRIWMLDDSRVTPAHTNYDGANYYPTSRWVLFGHHFAAITGAGPLVGPMLAVQFGYAPGLIWLVAGVVLAGAVHDSMILWASTRRKGKSLAEIVTAEISPSAGIVASIAILFILVIAIAGLGINVVNALADSIWGTFTIAMTIPLGIFMGFWMYVWRKGRIAEATVIGVIGLLLAVAGGEPLNHSDGWFAQLFHLSRTQIVIALAIYGFAASVLPVWLLLSPRGYLSSFTKIGTIFFLAIGVIYVNPEFKMPALSEYVDGGGPIIPGPLFPFCFITIACGAISGFHALISSGTTSKMVDKESDIRPIGYGAMLIECVVGVMALVAASAMEPGDYFAINVSPANYAGMTFQGVPMVPVHLAEIEAAVGETVTGRTGGAVSLAVGMAQIFTAMPGMSSLLVYW
jgi:carbon starvation protein